MGGRQRTWTMMGVRGSCVIAKTDDGEFPIQMTLIPRGNVKDESLAEFDRFLAAAGGRGF
jgi:hypothetical protein